MFIILNVGPEQPFTMKAPAVSNSFTLLSHSYEPPIEKDVNLLILTSQALSRIFETQDI